MFLTKEDVVVYLASERDRVLTTKYDSDIVESEEPDRGIKVDNDNEFFITDGQGVFDHYVVEKLNN